MMRIRDEIKALKKTAKIVKLCSETQAIGNKIGNLPVTLFPKDLDRMIKLTKEAMELEVELKCLYSANGEVDRFKTISKAAEDSAKALTFLQRSKLQVI